MLLIFRVDWCAFLFGHVRDLDWNRFVFVGLYRKRNGMDAPGFASPIHTYRQNLSRMRKSNDPNGSETTNLCSLGVVDLDLTVCPDVFGLRAFDEKMPITRMLPGSSPCDLGLLIPDTKIGQDGFHDVVIENLIGTSTWRSRHISPSDVIGLRRRWPQAVFQVMRERSVELEDLQRQAYAGLQPAYRPVCDIRTEHSLDSHMMCHHLDLGQLWRCPVEWCAVWKCSIRECRDHFNEKHCGSETLKSFPAWTVTRDFWERALKPEISGIAVDIHLFHESG